MSLRPLALSLRAQRSNPSSKQCNIADITRHCNHGLPRRYASRNDPRCHCEPYPVFANVVKQSISQTTQCCRHRTALTHRDPQVLSPHLWSFSQHYQRGKYAADGKFDTQLTSKQCGATVLLKQLDFFTSAQPLLTANLNTPNAITQLPYPNILIKRSSQKSNLVTLIQQRLNAMGCRPTLQPDGYFGSKTEHSVKWLQARSSMTGQPLKVDGVVGIQTWIVLFNTKYVTSLPAGRSTNAAQ